MADETHANMSDHRAILTAMAASEARQEQILTQLQEMRKDMKEMLIQSREEAKKDREDHRKELAVLHTRINEQNKNINEVKIDAAAVKTKQEGLSKGIWAIALASVSAVIYAIFDSITKG